MKKISANSLKEILDQHKLWFDTDAKQGKCAYLTNENLADVNLSDVNLSFADIRAANLSGANLSGAILEDSNLTEAKFTGANLTGADLKGADLAFTNFRAANLSGANLKGANLEGAYLNNAIGLPDVSWIEPGVLVQLNNVYDGFYVDKECKRDNFIQDSIGMFIQNNSENKTIDMLVGERIIRNIPDWVKYSGMKKIV